MEITIRDLEHAYQKNTPFERRALYHINTTILSNSYTAIIGHTGSGKSTLLQHLNALLKPTSGSLHIGEYKISANEKEKKIKSLRKKVGIVFQFPEHQLFEETVEKDICFGPMNFGVSEKEAKRKAREALRLVGLDEKYLEVSPFDLSGGQMRRVAIAGVLAMEPEILVLDEPTAGLDPRGREEIMDLFYSLHKQKEMTTILVTHSMEDAAKYADQIIVMSKGTIALQGSPIEIFEQYETLQQLGLDVPETVRFIKELESRLNKQSGKVALTLSDATEIVVSLLKEGDTDVK
ncbi:MULTISPECIES: energy-coupling factor ABC transporter ATP-binding protein [Sutcliffiella]|uniref:Energy-coupling factor transporter ATP-binding protein EcfA2 n=1 Tax=Sutcliffiella cohnii TaxID=33932 RepID=A0A223KXD8_9BACI|nr:MULTISPECIES: energy-coupling factor ABC transporter ATP-binding protein [Sutcliffiella]AST94074.1 energy-coupling factor ABC transporter ATP-binding protein [Sutcliffiella cohnii]MED4018111.1 energy-coupling factor ABC transporter ATP-binding protein [Sutcliffiella cohnii]WBL15290.1 energy-coupling factor ABC transporter ATP-binding protein [Sutcliffiella sp. NC1]